MVPTRTVVLLGLAMLASLLPMARGSEMDWPQVTSQCKPWTYWWWMGSAVSREELQRHAKTYAQAGLGGMHIIPIYGAEGAQARYVLLVRPDSVTLEPLMQSLLLPRSPGSEKLWQGGRWSASTLREVI